MVKQRRDYVPASTIALAPPPKRHSRSRPAAACIIALAAFAVHIGALHAELVFDDEQFVRRNAHLISIRHVPGLFTENIVAGAGLTSNFYRPIQALTHFFDVQLHGLNAGGHHLTNMLLYAAMCAAVYLWLSTLASAWASFAAAMLFSLHPIQSLAAAYVSGRGDILSILFLCGTLLFCRRSAAAALACAAAAMLSKETMVVLPALLWLNERAVRTRQAGRFHGSEAPSRAAEKLRQPSRDRGTISRWITPREIPFWILSALYVTLRLTVLNFDDTLNFTASLAGDAMTPARLLAERIPARLFTYVTTLPEGLRLWLWPSDPHHGRVWPIAVSLAEPRVLAGFAWLAAWLGAAAFCRGRSPAIAAGMTWFFVATLPTSNLVAVINAAFFDHWFILPGLGLALCVAKMLEPAASWARNAAPLRRMLAISPFAAIALVLAALTVRHDRAWRDAPSLYQYILRFEPLNGQMHYNLAAELFNRGKFDEALIHARQAAELSTLQPEPQHALGRALDALGRFPQARTAYLRAVEIDPRYFRAWLDLGKLDARLGRTQDALSAFERVLAIHPRVADAFLGISEILAAQGNIADARRRLTDGFQATGDERLRRALESLPP